MTAADTPHPDAGGGSATDRIDRLVREYVIAGDDPRDPAASRNGVKTRAFVAVIAPSVLALGVLAALEASQLAQVGVPVALLLVTTRLVSDTINDACEEWDRRESDSLDADAEGGDG